MKFETLKLLKVPTELEYTDTLVSYLMRIAECRPFFTKNLSKPLKVILLRNAKVCAITYSNQIEGNTLSEKEVSNLIIKKLITTEDTDIIEIQNYAEALQYAETLASESRAIKISDFCDFQRLITDGLVPKSQLGKLRSIPVSIANSITNEIIDVCPEPHQLKPAMEDLWMWLEFTKNANPYLRAFAFHFIAVAIHPFADGNGRSCRLMQHLLLLQSGEEIARYVPSETAIMSNRDEYYKAIRLSKKIVSLTPILEFLAFCFLQSAEEITKEAKNILKTTETGPDARQDKILSLARKKQQIKTQDVIQLLKNIPRRTIERDLENLCLQKKLKSFGEKKARVYIIHKRK